MLAIRLQRLGRKALPVYRVAVQESQRHPSSGRVVAYVGAYNPHTKEVKLDKEKIEFYLKNGAQPSPRVVRLLEADKIALPAWVKKPAAKTGKIRHADKLRKNQPKEEPVAAPAEEATEAPAEEKTEE
jgi:small subunit ribosomal protein S16